MLCNRLGWPVTHTTVCSITFCYSQLILRGLHSEHGAHTRTQKQQQKKFSAMPLHLYQSFSLHYQSGQLCHDITGTSKEPHASCFLDVKKFLFFFLVNYAPSTVLNSLQHVQKTKREAGEGHKRCSGQKYQRPVYLM